MRNLWVSGECGSDLAGWLAGQEYQHVVDIDDQEEMGSHAGIFLCSCVCVCTYKIYHNYVDFSPSESSNSIKKQRLC